LLDELADGPSRDVGRGHYTPRRGAGIELATADFCSLGAAASTVDQLNGVWNSEWERSNPFGPAAPATANAVFAKLYHACNDTEDSRAALLLT
jgi:hypothetical protein